ncbi:MAG: AI-2E family transporter [Ruminococcaceae bacterium]|nr:AI-2E family transporter [Oscillospiraceae bacterium]
MRPLKNPKYIQIALYVFLTAISIILFTLLCMNLDQVKMVWDKVVGVIAPFIYGFIIAYLVNPIMLRFEKYVLRFPEKSRIGAKLKRPLGVTLGMIVFMLILSVVVGLVFPQVATSFKDLQSKITDYVTAAQNLADSFVREFPLFNGQYETLSEFLDVNEISSDIKTVISNFSNLLGYAADYAIEYGKQFVIEVKNVLIGVIAAVYFLLAKERLISKSKKAAAAFLSRRHYVNLVNLLRFTNKTVGGFIYGKIIDSIIIGCLTFILMSIFKMPFTLLISVIVGVTNVIPYFGPFIGAIPSAFIVFIADPGMTLWFILMIFLIQQLDGNVIGPKILGDSTGMTSLAVLVSITIAGGFFGFTGMILGVPAAAVLCVLFRQKTDNILRHKNASTESADYYDNLPVRNFDNEPIFIRKDETIPEEYDLPPEDTAQS